LPGSAAPVIQLIKEINVSQKKAGEANQGAQALQAENPSQELGSQESKKQPEKKRKDRLHCSERWLPVQNHGLRNRALRPGRCGLPEAATYLPQQPPREKNTIKTTAAIARMVNQFIGHVLC
jgi:hypothetical protein